MFKTSRITKWIREFWGHNGWVYPLCVHWQRKLPCNCEGTEQLRDDIATEVWYG